VAGQAGYLAMALAALGRSVACVSAVGDDARGRAIVSELVSLGVDTSQVAEVPGARTGLTVAIVRPDGERAFVTDLGASRRLDADVVDRALSALRTPPAAMAVVGLYNTPALVAVAGEILQRGREQGALTVFDPGWDPAGWPPATRAGLLSALKHVDLFLPNLDEARAITGLEEAERAAEALTAAGAETVVVKCGAGGSFARTATGAEHPQAAMHLPGPTNAVGAGDTFDAALIHALLNGAELPTAMTVATTAAGIYVARATDRFPRTDQIRQALPAGIPNEIL